MRVLVLGAYGFIGTQIVARLRAEGHSVVGAGRSLEAARRRFPDLDWIAADIARESVAGWARKLEGTDAVVHAAGILQNGRGDDVAAVQLDGTRRFYQGCLAAEVKRVVHISAIGADREARTPFMRTKGEADAWLYAQPLDVVVLRPGLVLGRGAYGGSALLRTIAALPGVMVSPRDARPVQVVDVDDLARAVAAMLVASPSLRGVFDLAHPDPVAFPDLLRAIRGWLGLAPARVVSVPNCFLYLGTVCGDSLGWMGWRNPLRRTALAQLAEGIAGDPGGWIAAGGTEPKPLHEILARHPATVADLWHARLFGLKPVLFGTLALFWGVTGLVTLGPGRQEAADILSRAGFGAASPVGALVGGALDVALGAMILWRPTAGLALALMGLLTAGYLATITMLLPQFWLDPLGPLVKALALAVLLPVAAAILPDR